MANRYIYPRGFEDIDPSEAGPGVIRGTGDIEVDRLFKLLMSDSAELQSWDYRVDAMRCAKRLFGINLASWIGNQQLSEYITIQAREFLLDTLCFMRTGNRSVHPRNWIDILAVDPVPLTHIPKRSLIPAYSLLKSEYQADFNYIESWLKQPQGLLDLVYSLYIAFGSSNIVREDVYSKNSMSPRNPKFNRLTNALIKNV